MKFLPHHPLSNNDFRQCLRIALAGTIGFTVCKLFEAQNGVFYVVMPILLLGLVPIMNRRIVVLVLASAIFPGLLVGVLSSLWGDKFLLMIPLVFLIFCVLFWAMATGPLYLFGCMAVLNFSIMLHFGSYPTVDITQLVQGNIQAGILAVVIAFLLHALIPDVEARPPRPQVDKSASRLRHEILLGAVIATISYIVFQVMSLQDAMSAQATSVVLLFRMNWDDIVVSAKKRATGTIMGVSYGIIVQCLLYDWSDMLILIIGVLWIGLLIFSQMHVKERFGSGAGFGAMSTLAVLFGQYLTPTSDLLFKALYRVGCIASAIVVTLFLCLLLHKFLNRFEATRFSV